MGLLFRSKAPNAIVFKVMPREEETRRALVAPRLPRSRRLRPGQDATRGRVRVLALQVVGVAVDELVVLSVGRRAERRAEVPGALVAVLVADAVVPGVPL